MYNFMYKLAAETNPEEKKQDTKPAAQNPKPAAKPEEKPKTTTTKSDNGDKKTNAGRDDRYENIAVGGGVGGLVGLATGLLIKKLINGSEPLTMSDAAWWGGGGALIGGLGGAGLAAGVNNGLHPEEVKRIDDETAALKEKIKNAPSWMGLGMRTLRNFVALPIFGATLGSIGRRSTHAISESLKRGAAATKGSKLKAAGSWLGDFLDSKARGGGKWGLLMGGLGAFGLSGLDFHRSLPGLVAGSRESLQSQLDQLNAEAAAGRR